MKGAGCRVRVQGAFRVQGAGFGIRSGPGFPEPRAEHEPWTPNPDRTLHPIRDKPLLGRTRHVHFVGIGGIGMSGIAELLANLGYVVSGSDEKRSVVTRSSAERWASPSAHGHDARHVGDADVVVVSSAVRATNPEVVEATRRQIPVIPRAEMLGGADAAPLRDRGRRRARQDDDDVDDCARARARGAGSDGRHRRPAERLRQQRAARARRAAWWPRRTKAIGRS